MWGHELMLYSGGGWTSELHMTGPRGQWLDGAKSVRLAAPRAGFVRAAWRLDGRARRDSKASGLRQAGNGRRGSLQDAPRLLLVERRNGTSWGRWRAAQPWPLQSCAYEAST